jgi:tetratricopeptide (TPR) repeat protein
MRIHVILCFGWLLLSFRSGFAETYKSDHFTIHSDLDPRYVQFIQANAEAYYKNIVGQYFQTGGGKPLTIYYSKTQSETFQLLRKHGHKTEAHSSYYVPNEAAIYTHRLTNEGVILEIGTLFHEITHHFVSSNFKDPPAWFNEGLACFLGDETRIVKGGIKVGEPSPKREEELKERTEKGIKPNLKRLFPMTQKQLYDWPIGYNFSRALFYWLYENRKLEEYLQNVQKDGYELWVLEQTVHKSVNEINKELLAFIQKDCYAGAYLRQGWRSRNEAQKREAFLKALQLKPNYRKAKLELALCFYRSGDYKQCRSWLRDILQFPESSEYRDATEYMGHSYYKEGNYTEALEYYQKSLEYSDYYEYKYNLYYGIACCHHNMKDYTKAKKFYKMYLDNNWESEKYPKEVAYAKEYHKPDANEGSEEKLNMKQNGKD